MSLLDNLVSYWKLDEASGDALDAHGSNDLTDNNTVGSATGKIGNARDFVPTNSESFTHADNDDLSIADTTVSFEFSLWFKPDTLPAVNRRLVSKSTGTGQGNDLEYLLRTSTTQLQVLWGIGAGTFGSFASGINLSVGAWSFITFGYDASVNRFFVSHNAGSPVLSVVVTNQTIAGVNPFAVGGITGQYSDGLIDEMGFWKGRTLTSDERTALYNGGNGKSYDTFGTANISGSTSLTFSPNASVSGVGALSGTSTLVFTLSQGGDLLYGWLEYAVDSRCQYGLTDGRTHFGTLGRAHYDIGDEDAN